MTVRTAAATLLIVSGALIVAASVGITAYLLHNPGWLDAQLDAAGPDLREQIGTIDPTLLSRAILISGAVGIVEGGLSIGLGWLVHRGHRWAIGTSIAMTSVRLLLIGLCVLVILAGVALGQPSGGAVNAILTFAIAAVLIANLVLLFIARRRVPPIVPPLPQRPKAEVRGL